MTRVEDDKDLRFVSTAEDRRAKEGVRVGVAERGWRGGVSDGGMHIILSKKKKKRGVSDTILCKSSTY